MREHGVIGFRHPAAFAEHPHTSVESDFAEGETAAEVWHCVHCSREMDRAIGDFAWGGLVVGRGAMGDRRDGGVYQLQTIAGGDAGRLIGESLCMHGGKEEIAGTVARKHSAGAVGPVSRGGEADDEQPGLGRSEVGNGFAPLDLVAERGAFFLGDRPAIFPQPRAALALDDRLLEALPLCIVLDRWGHLRLRTFRA
jgi:hypothetical protein